MLRKIGERPVTGLRDLIGMPVDIVSLANAPATSVRAIMIQSDQKSLKYISWYDLY